MQRPSRTMSDSESSSVVCENCGSSNFYRDAATDSLICNVCHTQSQSHSQRESCEIEENIKLAAKGKNGTLMDARRPGSSQRMHRYIPNEELDNSSKLPDLVTCCHGFQQVLMMASERAAVLSKVSMDETGETKRAMVNIAGDIWFKYLQAWKKGAEWYGRMYPELRISLRDAFLDDTTRYEIYPIERNLSLFLSQKIRRILTLFNISN